MFCHEGWDSDSDINTYEDKQTLEFRDFMMVLLKEIQDSWYLIIWGIVIFFHHFDIN